MPDGLSALARETVSRRVRPLPFTKDGITLTADLIRIAMECLNAEPTGTLRIRSVQGMTDCMDEGLDRYLHGHPGTDGDTTALVLAEVLVRAGISVFVQILDRQRHRQSRGIRLLPAWRWHIGSLPSLQFTPFPLPEENATPAWMAVCPVCRTGILGRVTGRRLFGLPRLDHHIECSHCGAKFIPEQDQFRLASIARITDPCWHRCLNTSRTPDEWAAMARGIPVKWPGAPVLVPKTRKMRSGPAAGEGFPVVFPAMKNGSVAVPCGRLTLYFRPLTLQFTGGLEYDLFARAVRTVRDTLTLPAFQPVRSVIEQRHARYLQLRMGLFAAYLMRQGDPLAGEILNRHGGGPFCRFRVRDNEFAGRKGVFMVYVQGRVCHTGACHVPFSSGIEERVGRIMPDMCYRDGDETACRINRIVAASRPAPALYVHGMTDDAEIDACAAALGSRYPPIAAERLGKDA